MNARYRARFLEAVWTLWLSNWSLQGRQHQTVLFGSLLAALWGKDWRGSKSKETIQKAITLNPQISSAWCLIQTQT